MTPKEFEDAVGIAERAARSLRLELELARSQGLALRAALERIDKGLKLTKTDPGIGNGTTIRELIRTVLAAHDGLTRGS